MAGLNIRASGQWYQGRHDPRVTQAEFNRVQTILGPTDNPRPKKFGFRIHRPHPMRRMRFHGDGGEKYQVICSECRLKFASLNRNACPRCETPIEKMTGATFLPFTIAPLYQTEESAMHTKMRERA